MSVLFLLRKPMANSVANLDESQARVTRSSLQKGLMSRSIRLPHEALVLEKVAQCLRWKWRSRSRPGTPRDGFISRESPGGVRLQALLAEATIGNLFIEHLSSVLVRHPSSPQTYALALRLRISDGMSSVLSANVK